MHPGMIAWWKRAHRHAEHAASAHCGHGGGHGGPCAHVEHAFAGPPDADDFGGGAFGVRRPLRFLAFKLELEDKQVAELAAILDELKTERAQAAVDNRRATTAYADAIAAEPFDAAKVAEAGAQRVKIAERLRDAVSKALERIHAMLDAEQRQKLAYLIRTGALTI